MDLAVDAGPGWLCVLRDRTLPTHTTASMQIAHYGGGGGSGSGSGSGNRQ
jgi:hypothetical protein